MLLNLGWPEQTHIHTHMKLLLKVAFIQKILMHLLFPQTDEPHYFPELEF